MLLEILLYLHYPIKGAKNGYNILYFTYTEQETGNAIDL
jgi:hypothetical protein